MTRVGPAGAAGAPVIVLDDDPTGTQCAADVAVALDPAPGAVASVFGDHVLGGGALYVLTNTRAVDARAATDIVRGVRAAALARHPGTALVLRGDSTLRGHVAAEMAALDLARGVGLLVPAYPAAGRRTVDGVHRLDTSEGPVNVADTEFARDPVFGFRARDMAAWAAEVGLRGPVEHVARDDDADAARVCEALLAAPDGAVVVPDAATDADIAAIARAYRDARAAGRHVVVRCAAPLAAAIAGTPGRLLVPVAGDGGAPRPRMLVVCGSHTAAATRQLAALAARVGQDREPRRVRVLPSTDPLASGVTAALVDGLRDDLARDRLAIVATERVRRGEHGTLDDAARVMTGLMRVVLAVAADVDVVVAKGGITSAEVARTGLGGVSAWVRGQIATGVSLWDVAAADGRVVPQAVVPGNVGDDATLVEVCRFLGLAGPD